MTSGTVLYMNKFLGGGQLALIGFFAFFHSSLSPVYNLGGVWPPESIQTIQTSGIPLTNTFFLLSSGATVT